MKWLLSMITLSIVYQISSIDVNLKRCMIKKRSNVDIVTRRDHRYKDVNYQVIIRKVIHPEGYIFVKNAEDVQKAIECGQQLNLHFAIQSGGHSFEKFSYGSNDSWVLSLALMKKTEYDSRTKTVTVGPGNRLSQLTYQLWNICKCAVPVGECSNVGIAGYALGGGFGLLSRTHGLLSDNIVEIEIVTADRKIRRVNETSEPDLFWALRGAGGGNFGVVTQFRFRTFDVSHEYIWVAKNYTGNETHHSLFKQLNQLFFSKQISSSVAFCINGKGTFLMLFLVIDAIDDLERELLLQLVRTFIPSITKEDVKRGTFIEFYEVQALNSWSVEARSHFYYKAKSFYVNKYLKDEEIENFVRFLHKNPYIGFLVNVYGGAVNQKRPSETAFVHRNCLYEIQLGVGFTYNRTQFTNEEIVQIGDIYRQKLNYVLSELDFMDSGQSYQNYVDEDRFDWFERYYGSNGARLHRIKWIYDRHDFFYFNQSIAPINLN